MRIEEDSFFWEGTSLGELRAQRCSGCQRVFHPPRPTCEACQSYSFDHVVLSSRGRVFSHATVHRPLPLPHQEPFVVALIELEHDVRLVAEIVTDDNQSISIGVEVEAEYTELEDGRFFPRFRYRPDGEAN